MNKEQQDIKLWMALVPFVFLVTSLTINVLFVFKDSAHEGSNQLLLLLTAGITAILGLSNGTSWNAIKKGVFKSLKESKQALFILLLIGALTGTWLLSGVVPAMIYYGLELLSPTYFLVASVIISALVSLATGSSWGTTATVGIALLGVGKAMSINEPIIAGAIISGAYFGDKLSPLSDTTNLAPAMAGTDLFTHIRYMLYTTVPSILIALILFLIIGAQNTGSMELTAIENVQQILSSHFYISPVLFLVPLTVIVLIAIKIPALPALFVGTVAGGIFALVFQTDVLISLSDAETSTLVTNLKVVISAVFTATSIPGIDASLSDVLSSGGMAGMLNTVLLVIAAMCFGGAMEATGFLARLASAMLVFAKNTFSLVATTGATCTLVNITASDQYLSIIVPGKMFSEVYKKRGLAPENLSRTLEDTGTVTSVLVPWNTCGAYQAGVLGVSTLAYLPYCFFNILSPMMTLLYAAIGFRIAKLKAPLESRLK
ncbi:MAG: Na+/H+ antiporter NhaC [Schleiferiaceae bacterium]|nr:Na+/H+ antiporter NhaC [Schleiferiaceae bacterium]